MYQLGLQFCLAPAFPIQVLILSYNYCHWSQHTHIWSTWHFSEPGPQADADKICKCCKCMQVAKGSLKPGIFHKNNQCLASVWSCSTGHSICGTISWYIWLTWERNKYKSKKTRVEKFFYQYAVKKSLMSLDSAWRFLHKVQRQTCWKLVCIYSPQGVGLECMVDILTSSLQTGGTSSFWLFKKFIHFFFFNELKK